MLLQFIILEIYHQDTSSYSRSPPAGYSSSYFSVWTCIPLHPNPSAPCVATPGAAAARDAADLLQLVLHGAGPLHRVRGHRHRLHPAGQGLGRRLLRARRAHGHRAHALPPRLAPLPQGGRRQERHPRPRAGARRQLQEPPRAHAAGDGRRLELPQGRRQAQDSHQQAKGTVHYCTILNSSS